MKDLDHLDAMELDTHEIAGIALATLGVLIENYCEEGYCDPTMYRALALAEKLAGKLGERELATRLATTKMFAGEVVNDLIDEHRMGIDKRSWA